MNLHSKDKNSSNKFKLQDISLSDYFQMIYCVIANFTATNGLLEEKNK